MNKYFAVKSRITNDLIAIIKLPTTADNAWIDTNAFWTDLNYPMEQAEAESIAIFCNVIIYQGCDKVLT